MGNEAMGQWGNAQWVREESPSAGGDSSWARRD
jgi:hypothetical protein